MRSLTWFSPYKCHSQPIDKLDRNMKHMIITDYEKVTLTFNDLIQLKEIELERHHLNFSDLPIT